MDSKNAQVFKPTSSGEWTDPKSKQQQQTGEWVSSKNAQQQRSQAKSAIGELSFHAEHVDPAENIHVVPPINIISTPKNPRIAESHVE